MEITHQHKHTHTIPCFTIYCTVIVCKWYLHHGVVCVLMVLASPISSGSGSKPFPHSLLELEIKQAGTINLSTSCARSVTVDNKSVWIVQELNIQLPPTYMNNKDSIWHNSTVRKLVQIHLVSHKFRFLIKRTHLFVQQLFQNNNNIHWKCDAVRLFVQEPRNYQYSISMKGTFSTFHPYTMFIVNFEQLDYLFKSSFLINIK